jgi:hypothetical protein
MNESRIECCGTEKEIFSLKTPLRIRQFLWRNSPILGVSRAARNQILRRILNDMGRKCAVVFGNPGTEETFPVAMPRCPILSRKLAVSFSASGKGWEINSART